MDLSWFEAFPTFPVNQCAYKGVNILKEILFTGSKKIVPF